MTTEVNVREHHHVLCYYGALVLKFRNTTVKFSRCKMDIKREIKKEVRFSEVITEIESTSFSQDTTIKLNSDATVCNIVCETEIKEEDVDSDLSSHKDWQHVSENVMKKSKQRHDDYEMETKKQKNEVCADSDFCSQNKKQFSSKVPIVTNNPCNKKSELNTKIEIKEELWWLETTSTEAACVGDVTKDEDITPVKSPRLCTKATSDDSTVKSPLLSAEVSGKDICVYNRKDTSEYESSASDTTETATVENIFHSEKSDKYSDEEMHSRTLYVRQKYLNHQDKRPHKCKICEKRFTYLSDLNRHNLIHEGKKPYDCKTCDKSFTQLSNLKMHNLIHEGKKPHHCKACDKSFTQLSSLKRHNLIHEGKKPHQCKTCDKSFTQLSSLKRHNLIHEGNKPHLCKTCDKSFIQLSSLRLHNLLHYSRKPPM